MNEAAKHVDPDRELQASVAGFCVTTFFSIVLFVAGSQCFEKSSVKAVLGGILCWGWSLAFSYFAVYCVCSIYSSVHEQIKSLFNKAMRALR